MSNENQNLKPKNLKILQIAAFSFFLMVLFVQVTLATFAVRAAFSPVVSYWAPGLHLATFLPPTPTPTLTPFPSPTPFCIETCQADCGCIF